MKTSFTFLNSGDAKEFMQQYYLNFHKTVVKIINKYVMKRIFVRGTTNSFNKQRFKIIILLE